MEKTISHRKPIKSPFDILNSQVEKISSDKNNEYHIPIKKIFEKVPKPTELKPLIMEGKEKSSSEKDVVTDINFSVPKQVIKYIDELILEHKRPLKSLRFDIEESSSTQEIVGFLNNSKSLTESERKKLLGLVDHKEIKNEESHKKSEVPVKSITTEDLNTDLSVAREYYIEKLTPYLRKNDIDRKGYEKLMADLGVNKPMPKKSEPKDLVSAREEYINLKNNKKKLLGEDWFVFDVEETAIFREQLAKYYKPSFEKFISRANNIWDKTKNEGNDLVYSFLLEDIDFPIRSSGATNVKYDGLRTRPSEAPVESEPVQNETVVAESVNPKEIVYPSDFEGKNVLVVRGEEGKPNIVKVLFDGKEIAKGELTEKGPNIKINPEFKASWLFTKTTEQKAFDEMVLPFLKTLKF